LGIFVTFAWRDWGNLQQPSQDNWSPWFYKYEPGLYLLSYDF